MCDVRRCARSVLAAGLLLLGGGCSALGVEPAARRLVALPSAVAAAVTAGALAELLVATPTAALAAAPVRARADGGYEVDFVRDRHARWSADTDGRLALQCGDDGVTRLVETAASQRRAFDQGRGEVVSLRLLPHRDGTEVLLLAPEPLQHELTARLERALRLAVDHRLAAPGSTEPNLSAWRLGQLIAAARQQFEAAPQTAAELLRHAARLPQAPPCVHAELAELCSGNGDTQRAIAGFRQAALLARDPQQRATWSRAAAALLPTSGEPSQLRSAAIVRLEQGDTTVAETLLHSARRAARSPALDYDLLARLHRRGGDELAALAADLLARESGATNGQPSGSWREHLARRAAAVAATPAR